MFGTEKCTDIAEVWFQDELSVLCVRGGFRWSFKWRDDTVVVLDSPSVPDFIRDPPSFIITHLFNI